MNNLKSTRRGERGPSRDFQVAVTPSATPLVTRQATARLWHAEESDCVYQPRGCATNDVQYQEGVS